ncbi:hypothetical protein N7474_010369 [Penicillium riverlandense]|uniref:uncharacterized protein n=1 Tax=Penicillium riverlandense TaxID=1903569 RepID=UPI0025492AA4|nr:uncharacterized protein N7474_010369 [Penicillium riverlandense]KAJ5806777.1 hypothetical protein N7474_010369 [Penicillium riverlandense]
MSSRKKPTPARKKEGIHFVNARPSSETEKINAQRLVRAHVGRWISDQTKDRSSALESSTAAAVAAGKQPARDFSRSLVAPRASSFSSGSGSGQSAELPRDCQGSPFALSQSSESSDSSDDGSLTMVSGDKMSAPWGEIMSVEPLISGVFDPFGTYPSNFAPEMVHMCETYCMSILWPGLAPSRPVNNRAVARSVPETWFPLSMTDPALFTAFMFASLCHQRVQWLKRSIPGTTFGPRQQQLLELCEMESIKLISQAVRDPTRAVSDAVILSVICMAHHRSDEEHDGGDRPTPFNPPLQRLQWIDVYGRLPPNMIHIQGLIQLIKLRGGLDSISLKGLAPTISFSDIFTCSCLCIAPGFEFRPLEESRRGISVQEMLGYTQSDVENGFGQLVGIGITPQMAEALHAIYTYINIVKAHENNPGASDLSLLADQRNITQHTHLSLPPADQIMSYFSHSSHASTYEASRLAAMIFGVGVIFPIPAKNSPLPNLAFQMQAVLREPDAAALWSSPSTRIVLLWVLTLGAIAAVDSPARTWYVSMLGDTARRSGLSSWSELKNLLEMMLWYDVACDVAGETLWFEIERTLVTQ